MSLFDTPASLTLYLATAKPVRNFHGLTKRWLAVLRARLWQLPNRCLGQLVRPTVLGSIGFARWQEIMVNIMLGGLATITVVKLSLSLTEAEPVSLDQIVESSLSHLVFLTLLLGIWQLCRVGYRQLARQRDQLEIAVAERTRELWDTQGSRNEALQRYAEFGRLSASLLHEVSIPLTAATLNLDQFDGHEFEMVMRARKNLQQLERYIEAARQHLKPGSTVVRFNIGEELDRLLLVMEPLARQHTIKLVVEVTSNTGLKGDPVKFNQLVANLIANAIDAYDDWSVRDSYKRIVIRTKVTKQTISIQVIDWGKGISVTGLSHIFEPFYTTKANTNRGIGIGLSIVKHIVEEDFRGEISVNSTPKTCTTFSVVLPRH